MEIIFEILSYLNNAAVIHPQLSTAKKVIITNADHYITFSPRIDLSNNSMG